jgi:hypothetical protein
MQLDRHPFDTSLRGLDAVNSILASALSGYGPYVAVFLAQKKYGLNRRVFHGLGIGGYCNYE